MNKLQEIVAGLRPKPSRALLLAFDASAPFVDHVVFPAILSDQLHDVTILTDELTSRASAVDAGSTRRAGIYYRSKGVRVKGGRLFHPKLLCLLHDEGAHVLIGSANLTWSSWCRNLEIMDVLTFGPRGTASRRAGAQIAEFLRGCREALIGLGAADHAVLDSVADAVQMASEVTPEAERGSPTCEVLHSLDEPLLGQLLRRTTQERVTAITIVSPFHDPTNLALGRFVAGFSGARIRVIKDGLQPNDFDGGSFLRLGKRVQLHETAWGDEAARPLHAKALLLQANTDAWLVTGSANLTSPAWLRSAGDGGNVELITVRHASGITTARASDSIGAALFKEIPSRVVKDPASLVCKIDDQEENAVPAALHVVEAVEKDETILLRWLAPGSRVSDRAVTVTLRSQDREVSRSFTAVHDESGWCLEIDPGERFARAVLDDEIAVVVRLEQRIDEVVLEGNAWLQRADLLGQHPQILAWRHQLRRLTSRSNTPEEVIEGIVALIEMSRNAEDAFRTIGGPVGGGNRGHVGGSERSVQDRPSEVDLLRASLRSLLHTRRPVKESHGALTYQGRSDGTEVGDVEEGEPNGPDFGEEAGHNDRQGAVATHAESLASKCKELVSAARAYAARTRIASVPDERLEDVTSGLLLHGLHATALAERQSWLVEHDQQLQAIRHSRRELWSIAFSIDGWEAGQCEGWFPTMLTRPQWERLAGRSLMMPDHLSWALIDLASCTVLEEQGPASAEAVFAIQMLTGIKGLPSDGVVGARVAELSQELVADDPRLTPDALAAALQPAGIRDLKAWPRLQRWLPFVDFSAGKLDKAQFVDTLPEGHRRALSSLLRSPKAREKIATVRIRATDAVCGECDTVLAVQAEALMLGSVDGFTYCEACNRLIVPIDRDAALWACVITVDPERTALRGDCQ